MEEENTEEYDYVDQEEPEEMEMEAEELEEEATPQEQAETMEPMEDAGVETEGPTSSMAEAFPQEPASPVKLAGKFDCMITTEADPQLVDIATEGTPQGPPTTMEPMEEGNLNEEEVVTIPTIEAMEEEEQGEEWPRVGEAMGPVEEALGELECEVGTDPQELALTSRPNIEDSC